MGPGQQQTGCRAVGVTHLIMERGRACHRRPKEKGRSLAEKPRLRRHDRGSLPGKRTSPGASPNRIKSLEDFYGMVTIRWRTGLSNLERSWREMLSSERGNQNQTLFSWLQCWCPIGRVPDANNFSNSSRARVRRFALVRTPQLRAWWQVFRPRLFRWLTFCLFSSFFVVGVLRLFSSLLAASPPAS